MKHACTDALSQGTKRTSYILNHTTRNALATRDVAAQGQGEANEVRARGHAGQRHKNRATGLSPKRHFRNPTRGALHICYTDIKSASAEQHMATPERKEKRPTPAGGVS